MFLSKHHLTVAWFIFGLKICFLFYSEWLTGCMLFCCWFDDCCWWWWIPFKIYSSLFLLGLHFWFIFIVGFFLFTVDCWLWLCHNYLLHLIVVGLCVLHNERKSSISCRYDFFKWLIPRTDLHKFHDSVCIQSVVGEVIWLHSSLNFSKISFSHTSVY